MNVFLNIILLLLSSPSFADFGPSDAGTDDCLKALNSTSFLQNKGLKLEYNGLTRSLSVYDSKSNSSKILFDNKGSVTVTKSNDLSGSISCNSKADARASENFVSDLVVDIAKQVEAVGKHTTTSLDASNVVYACKNSKLPLVRSTAQSWAKLLIDKKLSEKVLDSSGNPVSVDH